MNKQFDLKLKTLAFVYQLALCFLIPYFCFSPSQTALALDNLERSASFNSTDKTTAGTASNTRETGTTMLSPHFSDNPTDEEFFSNFVLPEPLVPMGAPTTSAENKALAKALLRFHKRKKSDDYSALVDFLDQWPHSSWRVALLTDLGLLCRQSGYYSRALSYWQQAWKLGKSSEGDRAYALVDRAVGELIELNSRLGRKEAVLELFEELKGRNLMGSATESVTGAREGLWSMKNTPEKAFMCGPLAVCRVFETLHPGEPLGDVLKTSKSTSKGTSLAQVAGLARDAGLDYQMAKRPLGATVPVPCVVHWKSGHFAALTQEKDGNYFARDATFGQNIWVSKEALDEEASGYFLIAGGALPDGWTTVSQEFGEKIWGKGKVHNGDPGETRPGDIKVGDSDPLCGMATYSIHALLVSLNIVDTPVFFSPPVGPSLAFTVSYNQREAHQGSGNLNYPNIGRKWSFGWLAYVIEKTINSSTSEAEYHTSGGGYETYTGQDTSGNFQTQLKTRSKLKRIFDGNGTTRFELTFPDGSKQTFGYSDGATSERKWFMTQYQDPQGNALNFTYALNYSYNPNIGYLQLQTVTSSTAANPPYITATAHLDYTSDDHNKITQVSITTSASPSGTRTAKLVYDSSFSLVDIKDAVGNVSRFTYQSEGTTDFIDSLTTPYGTTTFSQVPYPGYAPAAPDDDHDRWLVATDPLGGQERVVFKVTMESDPSFPTSESSIPVDSKIHIYSDADHGQYLQYRNTFFWGKNAMASVADPNHPDWKKAKILHWLHLGHSGADLDMAAGILESEKSPLESRVWYFYNGPNDDQQPDNRFLPIPTATVRPSIIARVLDNGATQIRRFEYNDLGMVTKFTDPVGRETSFDYDSNLIDLLNIRQTTSGENQLLRKFSYTYPPTIPPTPSPPPHCVTMVQNPDGQRTKFQYNSLGQVIQITDPKGNITTLGHNANSGFLETILVPDVAGAALTTAKRTTTFTPDSFFRVNQIMDGEGYILSFQYDDLDRLVTMTFPDATTKRIVYSKLNPVLVKDRLNRWAASEYDPLGRLVLNRDAGGRTTRFDWCRCGALGSITDPLGRTTTLSRDLQGRVTQKIYPNNSRVTYTYEQTTSRLSLVKDAMGQTKLFQYNLDDSLALVNYSGSLLTLPSYPPLSYPGVLTPTVSFTYDPVFNRIATMHDGIGTTTFNYKPITVFQNDPPHSEELPAALGAGRLSSIDGPLADSTFSFGYDELGRVLTRTDDGNGPTTTLQYDELGRIKSEQNFLGTFNYTYQGASLWPLGVVYPNGQNTAFTYYPSTPSAPGLPKRSQLMLKTIANTISGNNNVSQFEYGYTDTDQINMWTNTFDANPYTYYGFTYDPVDQLLTGALTNGTTLVKQFAYSYDAAGNRTSEYVSSPASATTAAFNNVNELSKRTAGRYAKVQGTVSDPSTPVTVTVGGIPADVSGGNFTGYAVVSADSRTVSVVSRDAVGNQVTNTSTALSTAYANPVGSDRTYTYDLNGNVTSATSGTTTDSYEWDGADRMVVVQRVTSGTLVSRSEFSYDGLSRMSRIVEKNSSGSVTSDKRLVWCSYDLCEERDNSGAVTKRYFPLGMLVGSTKYFYTRDHLGSIREMLDNSGVKKARYDYDPYGRRGLNQIPTGAVEADFGYTGQYFHAPSGLSFAIFRAYDADSGRWMNRDPIGTLGGLNLHGYVDNDPINALDPLGLSTVRITTANGTQVLIDATPAQVRAALAATADGSITGLEIQGHGNEHFVSMGPGGTTAGLTDMNPGKVVFTDDVSGTSFGDLLLPKLAPKARVDITACNTARTHLFRTEDNIALSLSLQLIDHPVSGLRGFGAANELSNPFNRDQYFRIGKENHGIGITRTYLNGK
jgi:RHS repeat-associated protein